MTIRNRELNNRFSRLEACAERAPEGTYEQAKVVAGIVADVSNALLRALRAENLKALNDDRLRDIEAAIYGYILESNPSADELIAAEGFGAAMDTDAASRVIRQAAMERDALRVLANWQSQQ